MEKISMEKKKMSQLIRIMAAALLVLACALPSFAELRCKDCPFPMKIGENQWLMPDSTVVVQIYEQSLPDSSYQMSVALIDSVTGELLANGTARRSKAQRTVSITLLDPQGHRVDGEIRWVNF